MLRIKKTGNHKILWWIRDGPCFAVGARTTGLLPELIRAGFEPFGARVAIPTVPSIPSALFL